MSVCLCVCVSEYVCIDSLLEKTKEPVSIVFFITTESISKDRGLDPLRP